MSKQFTLAARLAGEPEQWRELNMSLRFSTSESAQAWLDNAYPCKLRGVNVRCSVMQGLQPVRVAEVPDE